MNYKTVLYIIFTFLSAYSLSGINYNGLFKTNKTIEARVFVISISLALSYLLTNFVIDFLSLTSIID
jgi:uncharacterized integral membrane protein (TIGR02327 family)